MFRRIITVSSKLRVNGLLMALMMSFQGRWALLSLGDVYEEWGMECRRRCIGIHLKVGRTISRKHLLRTTLLWGGNSTNGFKRNNKSWNKLVERMKSTAGGRQNCYKEWRNKKRWCGGSWPNRAGQDLMSHHHRRHLILCPSHQCNNLPPLRAVMSRAHQWQQILWHYNRFC